MQSRLKGEVSKHPKQLVTIHSYYTMTVRTFTFSEGNTQPKLTSNFFEVLRGAENSAVEKKLKHASVVGREGARSEIKY